jgi:hypothetical protein
MANCGIPKIPPHGFLDTINGRMNLIVPQESTQDVANILTIKESDYNSSPSKESVSSLTSLSIATSSAPQGMLKDNL